ncbi:MAG: Outer membrane protein assembly factor BamA [Bryobacteraceae bacterium]|nr:Outer membrane protein assembly factor BamA [Bryobacteraceae bacterium]
MTRFALMWILALTLSGQTRKAAPRPKARTPAPKAQPGPEEKPRFPIVSLKVDGNHIFHTDRILAVAGIRLGEEANEAAFEAARNRLVDCGFFESVGYKYGPSADGTGYAASFQVKEIEQSYPVYFERIARPEKELRDALRKADPLFGDQTPGTKQILDRYARILEPVAGERIVGRVMPGPDGALRIVFQPVRMPPSVAEVEFVKNSVLPSQALRNAVAGAAVGALYDESKFRQILDAGIRPLYEARGRLRVSFPRITTEPLKDVNGLRVTVEVSEGGTFTLGDVSVISEALPSRDLLAAAGFKTDDIANFNEIDAGVDRMKNMVRRHGYLRAKATVERRIDDAHGKVNLIIKIDPGRRFTFSKLNIRGLDILSEPQIRKAWALKEGEPFNPDYPDAFLARLREEGVFENLGKTKAEVKTDEPGGTAEVTLYFSAGPSTPGQRGRRSPLP